jgi:hypothetical protein
MNLSRTVLIFFFCFCCQIVIGQVTFELTKFPKNNQLIPRNPATNIGNYTITGNLSRPSNITVLQARVWRDTVLEQKYTLNVPNNADKFPFSFPFGIKAELKNYTVELIAIKNGEEIKLGKATHVVSGDVFIINGQSNCTRNRY